MTEVYLIRHSKPMKVDNQFNTDSLQVCNEKEILSIEGEQIAKNYFDQEMFDNIDFVFSSNYTRAIGTAKYLAQNNHTNIHIISALGERKFGVDKWNDLPKDFEDRQVQDENYKMKNGESQKEVKERMWEALNQILTVCEGKKIAIVSHATALSFLLKKWCEMNYGSECFFEGTPFFDGIWNYCETFRLIFNSKKELQSIENIRFKKEKIFK